MNQKLLFDMRRFVNIKDNFFCEFKNVYYFASSLGDITVSTLSHTDVSI